MKDELINFPASKGLTDLVDVAEDSDCGKRFLESNAAHMDVHSDNNLSDVFAELRAS